MVIGCRGESQMGRVAASKSGQRWAVRRKVCANLLRIDVDGRKAAFTECAENRAFFACHTVQVAESFQMLLADAGDRGEIGLSDRAQGRNLTWRVRPDLDNHEFVGRIRRE